jgi:hypothetical protein
MSTQPQLLKIALDPKDIVYTPDWVAKDMVEFFKPSGRILEPCKGDGVFLKYLPGAEWCEIGEGKDFFEWDTPVDWVVGNPPFKQFDKFLSHSFAISDNIVYLIPADKPFNSLRRAKMVAEKGKVAHMRFYVDGPHMGMPEIHRPMAAFHFEKDYTGPMYSSMAALPSNTRCT